MEKRSILIKTINTLKLLKLHVQFLHKIKKIKLLLFKRLILFLSYNCMVFTKSNSCNYRNFPNLSTYYFQIMESKSIEFYHFHCSLNITCN